MAQDPLLLVEVDADAMLTLNISYFFQVEWAWASGRVVLRK